MKLSKQGQAKNALCFVLFIGLMLSLSCRTGVRKEEPVKAPIPKEVTELSAKIYKQLFQSDCGDSVYLCEDGNWGNIKVIELKEKPEIFIEGKESSEFERVHNNKSWGGSIKFKAGGRWREIDHNKESNNMRVSDWYPYPYSNTFMSLGINVELRKSKAEYDEEFFQKRYKLLSCKEIRAIMAQVATLN